MTDVDAAEVGYSQEAAVAVTNNFCDHQSEFIEVSGYEQAGTWFRATAVLDCDDAPQTIDAYCVG